MWNFSDSIFSLESQDLRYIYACLTETTLWKVMVNRVWDYAGKLMKEDLPKGFAHELRLQLAISRISTLTDAEVRFRLLAECASLLKIPRINFVSRQDCDDFCDRIVRECIELYRRQNPGFSGTKTEDLVGAVTKSLVGRIGTEASASEETGDDLAERMEAFLGTLPQDQQDEIRRKLGIEDLSALLLRRLIAQGSAGTIFAVTVEVAGFAAYKGAVVALASLGKLIGVTIPFGVYLKLTSLIAVLSNPLALLVLIGGGGLLKYKTQSVAVREQLIPVLVVLMMLQREDSADPGMIRGAKDRMIQFWQGRVEGYAKIDGQLEDVEGRLVEAWSALTRHREIQDRAEKHAEDLEKSLKAVTKDLAAFLISDWGTVAHLARTGPGKEGAQKYCELTVELAKVRNQDSPKRNVLLDLAQNVKRACTIKYLHAQKSGVAARLAVALLADPGETPTFLIEYKQKARALEGEIQAGRDRIEKAMQAVTVWEAMHSTLKEEKSRLQEEKRQLGANTPGLEEVYSRMKQGGAQSVKLYNQ